MTSGEHRAGYRHPRITEKRRTRQPFKIDRLAAEVREQIKTLRAEGRTWQQISEAMSLPKTSLMRWYSVRVEQPCLEIEVLARAELLLRAQTSGSSRKETGD